MNINSKDYWEKRFSTGHWEESGGRNQTESFAFAQLPYLSIANDFSGLLVDFGCGLGDAIPIYKQYFPNAKLLGIDVSESAIEKCRNRFGHIASFISGSVEDVPNAEIIVASNVFEHLQDDIKIASQLMAKCHDLYVIVPYKEHPLCSEHVRAYDENYFRELGDYTCIVYPSIGWSEYGLNYIKLVIKNIISMVAGNPLRARRMQIMFRFQREHYK